MSNLSDRLQDFADVNKERYADEPINDRQIATLLNLLLSSKGVAGMLDNLDDRISKLEKVLPSQQSETSL